MRSFDKVRICLENLKRRKVRTLLTVTGVVVGTCSIVVMISLGIGMDENQKATLAQMGDLTIISVYPSGYNNPDASVLNDETVEKISAIPGTQVATPFYYPSNLRADFYAGRGERYIMDSGNIVGLNFEALPLIGIELLEGEYPNTEQKNVMVIGEQTPYNFRDTRKRPGKDMVWPEQDMDGNIITQPFVDMLKDPITLRLRIENEDEKVTGNRRATFTVVDSSSSESSSESGTEEKEQKNVVEYPMTVTGRLKGDHSKIGESYYGIIMDIDYIKKLEADYMKLNEIKPTTDKQQYNTVLVKTTDISVVAEVEQAIKDMGFETYSMESTRKPLEQAARQQQLVLGGLGAISLFVAAIGITNTMIMSIYERTREIGVMKVLGCFVGDVRIIFLLEAGLIGFLGGIAGITLSYGISYALNYFGSLGMNLNGLSGGGMNYYMQSGVDAPPLSIIPLWLVGAAIVFSTLMGLIAGFYPANRAVKISALEAIKHE